MYASTDAARSDFVLAAALLVIGPLAMAIVAAPFEVLTNTSWTSDPWVILVMILAVAVAFPRWLTRVRGDGLSGFALDGPVSMVGPGLVLAAPILLAYVVTQWEPFGPNISTLSLLDAVLGRLSPTVAPSPTVSESVSVGVVDRLFQGSTVFVLFVGSAALWSFLVGRARRGFDSPDRSVTQALRTYGMTSAGVALVIGGLWAAVSDFGRPVVVFANVAALVAMILLVDRMIGLAPTTTRATFIGPIIVLSYLQIQGGSIDLAFNGYAAALSSGHLVVFAALIEARKTAWAALPLLLASAWIPGCSTLLPWGVGLGNPGC